MSGRPRVRSDPDPRPVLVPAGNKAIPVVDARKPALSKPNRVKPEKVDEEKGFLVTSKEKEVVTKPQQQQQESAAPASLLRNLSMSASCSSDASSSDSSQSRASTATGRRRSCTPVRRKKVESCVLEGSGDGLRTRKRCGWVTQNADPCYAAFHDEEWGVPVHDDKKLFELLSLSGALAELTWPAILNKRHIFREVFLDFDPAAVSKLNEKKLATPGSPAFSLLSEIRLRTIVENARQICKITNEFGSFDKYIWNFVNQKPIVSQFRYPRQVPVKTAKAEAISKDLVRRGFRSAGPTVVYSFMQVTGLTNDHLISCFRFQECIGAAEAEENKHCLKATVKVEQPGNATDSGLGKAGDSTDLVPAGAGGASDFGPPRTEDTSELGLARAVEDLKLSPK